ncbi:MAG: M48 family metallopeptidase, partial [Candidatus Hodarchaeota archaeon]
LGHEYGHYKNLDLLIIMLASLIPMIIYSIGRLLLAIAFDFDSYAAARGRDEEEEEKGKALFRFIILFLGLALVVVGYLAELGTYAISRSREKLADNFGALITGKPLKLAGALDRIANSREVHAKTRMFSWEGNALMPLLYIHVPWETASAVPAEWLSTHPPIKKRIAYLQGLALIMSPTDEI